MYANLTPKNLHTYVHVYTCTFFIHVRHSCMNTCNYMYQCVYLYLYYYWKFSFSLLSSISPDRTLTEANILQVTANIPLWNKYDSSTLDFPYSQHDEIVSTHYGEEAKREIVTSWLNSHPYPSWEHVVKLLRELERKGKGRKGAAEEVEEKYLKSELIYVKFNLFYHL